MKRVSYFIAFFLLATFSIFVTPYLHSNAMTVSKTIQQTKPKGYPTATIAGGCFWCIESDIRRKDGILFTQAGYTGGHTDHPNYESISTGTTGHAEAVQLTFDPAIISYEDILVYFMTIAHDPTQKNGQGVDIGTQYRSAIFYHDAEQQRIAQNVIDTLNAEKRFADPIITEIVPAVHFWPAEDYHQQYYEKYEANKGQPHLRVLLKEQKRRLLQQ